MLLVPAFVVVDIGPVSLLPVGLQVCLIAAYARSAGRFLCILLLLVMAPRATTELGTDSWITSLHENESGGDGAATPLGAGVHIGSDDGVAPVRRAADAPLLAGGAASHLLGDYGRGVIRPLDDERRGTKDRDDGVRVRQELSVAYLAQADQEQFPRSGAFSINVIAGVGMLAAEILGLVLFGAAQDRAIREALNRHDLVLCRLLAISA